jgi:hypothetical protein
MNEMGASAKTPPTPDYTGVAKIQGQNDQQIAQYLTQANRPNQTDPYGQTTWTQTYSPEQQIAIHNAQSQYDQYLNDPRYQQGDEAMAQRAQFKSDLDNAKAGGQWNQSTTFTPQQQQLLDQQQALKNQQNARVGQLIQSYQTPTLQQASQSDIANQMYRMLTQNYDQQFTKDEASQRAQLANQGFQQGSEGYNNALRDFFNAKNQAYGNAGYQSQLAGYNQMNTENSQNLNNYNTQMGYLSQLLGGVQGPTLNQPQYPGFAPATQYQSPDLLGALSGQYKANLNGTNAQNAASGQNMQTIGQIGTMAAMAAMML